MVSWWDVFSGDFEDPDKSTIKGKWGVSDSFSADGKLGPWVGPWTIGINNDSTQKEAAWKFVKWALSPETQKKLAATGATPPCRYSLLNDPEFKAASPTAEGLIKELAKGALTWPYIIESAKIEEEIMGVRLNQFLVGELSADEALALMQEEIIAITQ
jgi:multiple sugar transport system substrate-binding protein